jgi:hypothetical protein
MDWLEFVAAMTRALAWPAVIGVLVFAFREPIRERIPFLRSVKAGPLEATLDAQATKVSDAATAATNAPAVAELIAELADDQSTRLVDAIKRDEEARRTEIEDLVRYAVRFGHLMGFVVPPGDRLPEMVIEWTERRKASLRLR